MNNEIIQRWENLLATLTVLRKNSHPCTEAETEIVEKELGFNFPVGYQEYCHVFGSGSLGQGISRDFFRVYCPCCPESSLDIRRTGHNLIGLRLDLDVSEPLEEESKSIILNRLLEYGYVFADTDRADRFIWDLTTFNEEDKSYDIYWIPDEEVEAVRLIGRDFFDFIEKFCFKDSWKIMFPNETDFEISEFQERFFSAFEVYNKSDYVESTFEPGIKDLWESMIRHQPLLGNAVVELTCSYDAPSKLHVDNLQRAWSREEGASLEIIQPSKRPNIPRLVTAKVTIIGDSITQEIIERIFRKMVEIGKDCHCFSTSFGSSIGSGS